MRQNDTANDRQVSRTVGLRSDNPQAYVPGDRRRALAEGRSLPDRARGAAVVADISGFTPLTEALATDLGPQRGAEELTAVLDDVFGTLLAELERHGGDVIFFSGDAVTGWIDGDDGLTAVACGLAMQQVMGRVGVRVTATGREFRLGLKVAVAAGDARRFVVGDPEVQLIDVLAGALMDRLADAEHAAREGEVVLDAPTAGSLGPRVHLAEHEREHGVRVALDLTDPAALPTPRSPLPTLPEDVVRQWVLPRVYERMIAGRGDFLAELRPAVPLFLHFAGIDYDEDPDAIVELDGLVTGAQRIVAANGGNVLQLTIGDKGAYLFAVFGAPVAHEDDPARACQSALELLDLEHTTAARDIRIGVAAGSLRSGTYGHPERRTFACLGDAVNLAARLMSAAPPGGIYASAQLRRAAGTSFDWSEPRPLQVAGKKFAVATSQLLGRRQPTAQPVPGDIAALMVGRADELVQLQSLAAEAVTGRGQVVMVTGPGGVGKSRMLIELGGWLAERGVRVRTGAPRSYGARAGYGVWQDICRTAWGIEADATPEHVAERLAEVLTAVGPHFLARLPLLGTVVGVVLPDTPLTASFDAKLRKTSLESLMVDVLEASATRGPIAYLIDAAEHLDELSWDLVNAIGRATPRMPLLLLLARRPPAAGTTLMPAELAHLHEVPLTNLDDESSRELVANRFRERSSADLPGDALDRLIRLAGGNPFHLEELVNHLVDRGIDPARAAESDIDLPTSLQSLELARIDNLAESPRRTIRVASVVGARFDVPVVAGTYPELGGEPEVAEYSLALARASLVVQESDSVSSFAFRNPTTQQVAYESTPFASRRALHDRVVRYLETHTAAGHDAILDLLAYHASHGTDTARTREYLVRAAAAAQSRYANDAAVAYYRQAIPLVADEDRPALLIRLGKVLEISGHWAEAEQTFLAAVARYAAHDDERGWAHAQTDVAEIARKFGRFDDAAHLLLLANEKFLSLHDRPGLASVLHLQGTLASQQSRYEQARGAYESSLEIRRALGDTPKIGALLSNLAVVAEQVGDYDRARELNERALVVREEVGDPWAIAVSHNNLGMIALLQEDHARATEHIEESMRLAGEVGDRWIVAVGQHNNGNAQRGLGEHQASGAAYLAALQTYLDHDDRWSLALLVEDVALLAVAAARHDGALRLIGAADTIRAELDAPRPPALTTVLDAALAGPRAQLGSLAELAYRAGREMKIDAIAATVRVMCM